MRRKFDVLGTEGEKLLKPLFEYVDRICSIAKKDDKKIVVWGFGKCGKFTQQMFSTPDESFIDFFIDERLYIYADEPKVYRSSVLDYIDNTKYIIISTIKQYSQVVEATTEYGYKDGVTLFDAYSNIGEGYLKTICDIDEKINFDCLMKEEDALYMSNSEMIYHQPTMFPNIDRVFGEIKALEKELGEEISLVDYGCGNGGALVHAYLFGIRKLGGVDINEKMYKQALVNMDCLKIEADLTCGDARKYDCSKYNCIYMFNPFTGSIFVDTIKNIERICKETHTTKYLIYLNPTMHKKIVENTDFKLIKHVLTDCYDPLLNIYRIGD